MTERPIEVGGVEMPRLHSDGAELIKLVPNKTDKELAEELKKRIVEVYGPVLKVLDEIHAAGFSCGFQSGLGPLGKHVITQLTLIKTF